MSVDLDQVCTDDLEKQVAARKAAKKKRGEGVKKHGVGVSALLIAAFGAYEAHTNRQAAQAAAEIAADAKVSTIQGYDTLVKQVNGLVAENAALRTELEQQKEFNAERFEHLREWMKSVSRRNHAPEPAVSTRVITPPPPPAKPKAMGLLGKGFPERGEDYQQQVQQVLKSKGF